MKWTALVPAIIAVGYLLLIIYFKFIGGYRQARLEAEKISGGVEAPVR